MSSSKVVIHGGFRMTVFGEVLVGRRLIFLFTVPE